MKALKTDGGEELAECRRILIIDDSEAVLNESAALLRDAGYDVSTMVQAHGVDLRGVHLVLVDYHMPEANGGSVVESLRAIARASGVTPLFCAFTSDASIALRARQFGFDGAVTRKGDGLALVRQVGALFRVEALRELKGEPAR